MRCLETRSTVSLASVSGDHVQMIPMSSVLSCIDNQGTLGITADRRDQAAAY